jgi:hypothetical protein
MIYKTLHRKLIIGNITLPTTRICFGLKCHGDFTATALKMDEKCGMKLRRV